MPFSNLPTFELHCWDLANLGIWDAWGKYTLGMKLWWSTDWKVGIRWVIVQHFCFYYALICLPFHSGLMLENSTGSGTCSIYYLVLQCSPPDPIVLFKFEMIHFMLGCHNVYFMFDKLWHCFFPRPLFPFWLFLLWTTKPFNKSTWRLISFLDLKQYFVKLVCKMLHLFDCLCSNVYFMSG